MNNRLGLFRKAAKSLTHVKRSPARKLYTDHIYPYPFNYINTTKYPSVERYRETYPDAPWDKRLSLYGHIGFRIFWTGFFYQLYNDPGVILGHFHPPDPTNWTDAELGIPPDDAGPYLEWLKKESKDLD